jgi:hypothetical protein
MRFAALRRFAAQNAHAEQRMARRFTTGKGLRERTDIQSFGSRQHIL